MTRSAATWVALDRTAGDLVGQVHRAVRERILDGRLAAGRRLPSSRALAAALGVSRSTVVQAYERLGAEGFVVASTGSATRVAVLPAPVRRVRRPAADLWREVVVEPASDGAFHPGVPDLSAFPHAAWARCLAARARSLRIHDLGYGDASGLPDLKAAVLEHVSARRGVSASVGQVVIVPSTGAAVDLLARMLLRPGDVAWIEEPGYRAAQVLLRQAGARLVPVPCDAQGIDVSRVDGPPPRLVYVTPSHQYPTGATMSLTRRLALLALAQASGAIVLEDDYDSEFHDADDPIAALQGIDRGRSVAYLGTFSKVLAPGLRVGYAILPPQLVPEAVAALRLRGAVVPVHMQAALADFLREGHLRAHVRRMGPRYAERRVATADILRRLCDGRLHVADGAGGLQLAAWFRDARGDDRGVARALTARGFAMQPLSDFHLGPARSGLLFGIARATVEQAEAAARSLRSLLD